MKATKILSICLVACMLLTLPIFASEVRASEQLNSYDVDVNRVSGEIKVTVTVSGKVGVTKAGCQTIRVYEKVGSFWIMREELRENDPDMFVNSRIYVDTHTFDAKDSSEYRVDVTIFAENANGRDTRYFSYEV